MTQRLNNNNNSFRPRNAWKQISGLLHGISKLPFINNEMRLIGLYCIQLLLIPIKHDFTLFCYIISLTAYVLLVILEKCVSMCIFPRQNVYLISFRQAPASRMILCIKITLLALVLLFLCNFSIVQNYLLFSIKHFVCIQTVKQCNV